MFNRANNMIVLIIYLLIIINTVLFRGLYAVSDNSVNFHCLYYINKELTK